MKKFFAIFLSLVMILSLSVPVFAAETDTVTSTETGNNTATHNVTASYTPSSTEDTSVLPNPLYFKAEGATVVHVFTYNSEGSITSGDVFTFSMTAVEGETGVFSIDTDSLPADTVKVTFSFDNDVTELLDLPTDGNNMYDYDNSKWTTYNPDSTEPDTTTIYFDNSAADWNSVIAYYWSTTNTGMTTWPGVAMTLVEGEENIYSITVPADAQYVIFNNGSSQTDDLTIPTDGSNMYDYGNSRWTTYTPGGTEPDTTATITGLKVTVDGVTYESGTVTLTPNSGDVTITVIGTNLQNHSENNKIKYLSGASTKMGSGTDWSVTDEGTEASRTFTLSQFTSQVEKHELGYCNDGSTNYTGSGVSIIYDTGSTEPATIIGVSLSGTGVTYDETTKTYTVAHDATGITLTVTGTNLQKATDDNYVSYASGVAIGLATCTNDASADGTKISFTVPLSDFENMTAAYEIKYSNAGTFTVDNPGTGTGIYVQYQSEPISVNITWGAMSFTYDDTVAEGENGWTCAEGANKITVANNSTVAVNAAVDYTPANGYDWLGGYFEGANGSKYTNMTIDASGSFDFYLILASDKPEAAFSGTVGTVTVTITEGELPVTPPEE